MVYQTSEGVYGTPWWICGTPLRVCGTPWGYVWHHIKNLYEQKLKVAILCCLWLLDYSHEKSSSSMSGTSITNFSQIQANMCQWQTFHCSCIKCWLLWTSNVDYIEQRHYLTTIVQPNIFNTNIYEHNIFLLMHHSVVNQIS